MGLDMYLKVKYPPKPQNELEAINEDVNKDTTRLTGACGGLFGVAPADNGCEEIGYWRKAYSVRDLIMGTIASCCGAKEDNCVDFLITKEEVNTILAAAEEEVEKIKSYYKNHKLDEDEDDVYDRYFIEEDPDELDKWESTVDFFTKAKDIYNEYPDAKIYYEQWY